MKTNPKRFLGIDILQILQATASEYQLQAGSAVRPKFLQFSLDDLLNGTSLMQPYSRDAVGRVLRSLKAHGFIVEWPDGEYGVTQKGFAMRPDYVMDCRVIQRQILNTDPELTVKFWRLLRKRKILSVNYAMETVVDIGAATPHAYQYLTEYCQALERAGYVFDNSKEPDLPLRERSWYLNRDTGTAAPKILKGRKVIIDLNDQSFYEWS